MCLHRIAAGIGNESPCDARRGERESNDLWIIDLEGTFVWQVTHKPAAYDIYAWAPAPGG